MKFTKLFSAILITALFFASCKDSSKEGLVNAIPADASYVVYLNTQSMSEKSAYDIFQNITVARGINLAKGMLNKKEAIDMLDGFTKNVNSLGLDIKGDCYFYTTDYNTFGFVFGVNDAEKIKTAFTDFSMAKEGDIQVKDGVYSFSPESDIVMSWDKSKFVIIVSTRFYGSDGKPDLKALVAKQLAQKKDESIHANPTFEKFLAGKKDISVYYSYSNLTLFENIYGMDFPEEVKKEIEGLKGISTAMNVSFEKGEIKADNKVYYDTPQTEKKYKDLVAQLSGEIKGDQFKFVSDSSLFVLSANLKGAGIYSYLEKLGLSSYLQDEFKSEVFDVKALFEAVEGDLTFAVSKIAKVKKSFSYGSETVEYDSTEPLISFFADVKDGKKITDIFSTVSEQFAATKVDDNTYCIDSETYDVYFGVSNNMFYITNDKTVFNNLQSDNLKNDYLSKVKGNSAVMTGNFKSLKQMIADEDMGAKYSVLLNNGLDQLDSYFYKANKNVEGEGSLYFTDKSKNSFAVICQYFDQVLTTFNDEFRF
ncbi:MAG: DUF4836 family protein [Dysgonomonas sp.]